MQTSLLLVGYRQAFNREKVDLVTERILRVTAQGVVTATSDSGASEVTERTHDLDVLLLATGFKVMQLWVVPPFTIRGSDGV